MEWVDGGETARFAVTARRNNSLTSSGRLLVFGFIFALPVGIALGFAWLHGAWPLLPFAGAEALGLFIAYRYMERHAGDYERVTVGDGRLVVEVVHGASSARHELSRYWAKLTVSDDGRDCRMALRSHGQEIELGRYLDAGGRRQLARELRRELPAADQ